MKRAKRQNKPLSSRAQETRTRSKKLSRAKVAHDIASVSARTVGSNRNAIGKLAPTPAAVLDPEIALSSQSNLVGGQEVVAMMLRMGAAHRIWSDFWFQQMQRNFNVLPQVADSRTPVRLLQVAVDSAGTFMSDCMSLWIKSTNFSEAVQHSRGNPIHRAIVGDASRAA